MSPRPGPWLVHRTTEAAGTADERGRASARAAGERSAVFDDWQVLATLLVRSMPMSVCNMFHPVEQRCICWLLTVSDLIVQNEIPLTHELLATMLGVHRPTVTLVIGSLDRAGLVDEVRGQITIRDRAQLAAACCECYRLIGGPSVRTLQTHPWLR